MRTRTLLFTIALAPALMASKCSQPQPQAPADPCDLCEADEMCVSAACWPLDAEYDLYLGGSTGGIPVAENLVLDDQGAFEAYWARLNANRRPVPDAPADVEFRDDRLLAVHIGSRNSGGYRIAVDGLSRDAAGLTVRTTEYRPGPDCIVTLAITSPYVVIRTPQTGEPVQFAQPRVVVEDCR